VSENHQIRPRSNLFFAGANYLFLGGLAIAEIYSGFNAGSVTVFSWLALIGYCNHLVLVMPKVRTSASELTIINPFRTHRLSWPDIEEIDAKYTMYAYALGQRIHAWAAPVPGRYHTRNVLHSDLRGSTLGRESSIKAGELPNSHSGVALIICRREWESHRTNGLSNQSSTNEWHFREITLAAILGVITALAIVF
jgi:hypothetical protein